MNNNLTHHGVLGMKWGIRRTPQSSADKLKKAQKKWDKAYQREFIRPYNIKARKNIDKYAKAYANERLFGKKYTSIDLSKHPDPEVKAAYANYQKEFRKAFNKIQHEHVTSLIGERPE